FEHVLGLCTADDHRRSHRRLGALRVSVTHGGNGGGQAAPGPIAGEVDTAVAVVRSVVRTSESRGGTVASDQIGILHAFTPRLVAGRYHVLGAHLFQYFVDVWRRAIEAHRMLRQAGAVFQQRVDGVGRP